MIDEKLAARCASAAQEIAHRLAQKALWDGKGCTWTVYSASRELSATPIANAILAPGNLYQGTAGIGLFFAQAAQRFVDARFERIALAALDHSWHWQRELSNGAIGFHTGATGVAFAHARAAELLGYEPLLERARTIVKRMTESTTAVSAWDVVDGVAGAVAPLLYLHHRTGIEQARELSISLGLRLLAATRWTANGPDWGRPKTVQRALTGLAHGHAGIATCLLELWVETGLVDFAAAAVEAIGYEEARYDSRLMNWPDFRDSAIGRYVFSGDTESLAICAANDPLAGASSSMHAWCHGAPGIGLSRLRALELVGEDRTLRVSLERSVESTSATLRTIPNYSLCHGIFGNLSLLIEQRDRLNEAAINAVKAVIEVGLARNTGNGAPWPTGAVAQSDDPSLMVGEAGVGLALLQLEQSSFPDVLLPRGTNRARSLPSDSALRELRARSIRKVLFFGLAFEHHSRGTSGGRAPVVPSAPTVEVVTNRILKHVSSRCTSLPITARIELARAEVQLCIKNWSSVWAREISRRDDVISGEPNVWIRLAPWVRLVCSKHSRQEWAFLVYPSSGEVHVQQLAQQPAAILKLFRRTNTVRRAVNSLRLKYDNASSARLDVYVRAQVTAAWRRSILERVGRPREAASAKELY
jgi:hypothetical protein